MAKPMDSVSDLARLKETMMPDITMCQGAGERACEKCYRKQATVNGEHQSWIAAPPWKNGDCPYFIRIPATRTASDKIDSIASMFSNTTESEGDE